LREHAVAAADRLKEVVPGIIAGCPGHAMAVATRFLDDPCGPSNAIAVEPVTRSIRDVNADFPRPGK